MKLKQNSRRKGFTLVEMLVATALVMFIMLILSEAFVAGLEAFRTLKGIGDMEERLRAVALSLRSDLEGAHFESGVRLSDPNFWQQGNPKQGFLNVTQGFTPTTSTPTSSIAAPGPGQTVAVPSLVVAAALNPLAPAWTIQPGMLLLVDVTDGSPPAPGTPEYVLVQSVNPANNTFTANFQLAHPTAQFSIQFVRQFEGLDADGLPVSRATDHVLYLAVKQPGDRPENFFTGHLPYLLPPFNPTPAYPSPPYASSPLVNPFFAIGPTGLPNPNYVPTTFGDQPTDARFQDQLPASSATIGYKTQWAEVAYFLFPNGSTAPAGGGTPLYALYRCEFKVVPDSRYLNGQVFGTTPGAPLPPPPIVSSFNSPLSGFSGLLGLAPSWSNDRFNEMSCQLSTAPAGYAPNAYFYYSFNTPSDLAGSNVSPGAAPVVSRAFTASVTLPGTTTTVNARGLFNPTSPDAWSATLVATDVVSFDVQIHQVNPQGGLIGVSGVVNGTSAPTTTSFAGVGALSPTDNFYSSLALTFTSGLNAGQTRTISSYFGSAGLFTFLTPWPSAPSVGDTFYISDDFKDVSRGSFDTARTNPGYTINAIRIILRVWNMKTEQTRQVSIVQQL